MKKSDMLALANYIWDNYPEFQKRVPFWKLLSLLDRNEDKIVYIENKGKLCLGAFYLRLTEDNLIKVILGQYDLRSPEDLAILLEDKGEHIHFISCVADGPKSILKGLRKTLRHEKPLSVSWFKNDLDKVHMVYSKNEVLV